jgi:signal transduction histidine kinase
MLKKRIMPDKQTSDQVLHQLRHIAKLVMEAANADSMEQVLQNIAHNARELIGARYAALGVPDQKGGLRYFKVSGLSEDEIELIDHPPVGLGLLGTMMRDAHPMRLEHMETHPEAVGFPEGHPRMDSFMGVPIKLGDKLFGIFYLTDKIDQQPFTEDDVWLLEIMSGYAAMAIAEKQLQQQQRQLTLMREREQIGMALHDGVIQSIYALGMRLDLAKRQENISFDVVDSTLDGLNQVIEDIREAIFQLKKRNTEPITLRLRIQRILAQLYIPPDVNVYINLPEHVLPIDLDVLEALEMMLNECVSNILRHADATEISITAHDTTEYISILVKDNGIGFDPEELATQSGLGLRNLKRRANLHGGSIDVQSQPGEGTRIRIRFPLG